MERALRIGLWMLPGMTARAIDLFRRSPGGFPGVLEAPVSELAELAGASAAAALGTLVGNRTTALLQMAVEAEEKLATRDGRFVLRGDPDYPFFGSLRDPPEALSVRGTLPSGEAVAVVGSRECDAQGRDEARRIAAALVRAGRVVVSGGALGIDAAAHEGALDAGGRTVAVLASGVLRPGPPSNRRLFGRILETGALISEMPPLAQSFASSFPMRNRLVATMARAVVVVRAGRKSGTLHTAKAARKAAVPLLARIEGGAGCEMILRKGARPFDSVASALALLGIAEEKEHPILAALSTRGTVALVADRTGLPMSEVIRCIAGMCQSGLLRSCGPGEFVRT